MLSRWTRAQKRQNDPHGLPQTAARTHVPPVTSRTLQSSRYRVFTAGTIPVTIFRDGLQTGVRVLDQRRRYRTPRKTRYPFLTGQRGEKRTPNANRHQLKPRKRKNQPRAKAAAQSDAAETPAQTPPGASPAAGAPQTARDSRRLRQAETATRETTRRRRRLRRARRADPGRRRADRTRPRRLDRQRHVSTYVLLDREDPGQLRRFERRGVTARNRLEREVAKPACVSSANCASAACRREPRRRPRGASRDVREERHRDRRPCPSRDRQPQSRSASSASSDRPHLPPRRSGEDGQGQSAGLISRRQ